ncbi:hypothetical protein SAMN05660199_03584 [Klenkia soli]|uniref:ATP-grasp domain-containing protein n=1 Tax=Klenkia soli TaxID=1052260 RepID=A0A1H0RHP2_9ACTN|nr:ATP-grasp domain-containing protein [Klenkia soli]SDP28719.1 hypothetical protein SAMN05660199_03584 [Klenkia soli]
MLLLLPRDPLAPRRVDGHFAPEAAAARELGLPTALVDHDELTRLDGDPARAVRGVPADGDAVYRGWMLRSEQYAAMAGALADRDVVLRTSAEQYRTAHELPGWYAALAGVTPESRWDTDGDPAWLGSGGAVLRDHSKSLKHSWHEACFVPDVTDVVAARRVRDRFLELRGEDLVGSVVVRRFESFTGPEARTWWVDGRCALVTAHPDTPGEVPAGADLDLAAEGVAALGLPFVTVDLVARTDGAWRVVELGDGQVSDRPVSSPAADLLTALAGAR